MALDGIAIAGIVSELRKNLLNGRVDKIYQPEREEVIILIRSGGSNHKLLMSANSSHPRVHLSTQSKNNPLQAPLFCMVMRKHLTGGKIVDISQPDFERIIYVDIEAYNEMGDLTNKRIIVEIMGKHSNIILTDENAIILDCAKHITHETSSVREVLPGKQYTEPPSQGKLNPMRLEREGFLALLSGKAGVKLQEVIYKSYSGISPVMAADICCRAGLASDMFCEQLSSYGAEKLFLAFASLTEEVKAENFENEIIFDALGKPIEFSTKTLSQFSGNIKREYDSVSRLLEDYYSEKDSYYRINQRTADLRRLVQTNIERCVKKTDVYNRTMHEIKDRDKLRIYGELLTANIHSMEQGMKSFTAVNYYEEDCPEITIPLDTSLTPAQNAQRYFKKYNKDKRTYSALIEQGEQNRQELQYLETVLTSINNCKDEADINDIREELYNVGIIKKSVKNPTAKKSKPLHFISSEGFDIFVGKNNKQNDELTIKTAKAQDIWFHTKEIPGSHVLVKTNGKSPGNDTLNEAVQLAAYYSKASKSSLVPVDYTARKNVKKPNGAKPGMVIYDNYKTAYVTPDEALINGLQKGE